MPHSCPTVTPANKTGHLEPPTVRSSDTDILQNVETPIVNNVDMINNSLNYFCSPVLSHSGITACNSNLISNTHVSHGNLPRKQKPVSTYFFANIQGLQHLNKNKVPFISGLLHESDALFAAFTETHTRNHLDSELIVENYNLFRSERVTREWGGCCLYIHESLSSKLEVQSTNNMVELLIVSVATLNLVIIVLYRPPDTTSQKFSEQLSKVENFLKSTHAPAPNIIFMGDFNFPHIKWAEGEGSAIIREIGNASKESKEQFQLLQNFCNENNLNQYIHEKTRLHNTLDLIFTNNDEWVHNVEISKTKYSDHNLIEVTSRVNHKYQGKKKSEQVEGMSMYNFNRKNIDWESIALDFMNNDWHSILANGNIESNFQKLHEKAIELCDNYIPKRTKRKSKSERRKRLLFKRRKFITTRLKSPTLPSYHRRKLETDLKIIEEKMIKFFKEQEEKEEKSAIDSIKSNPKSFFSYAKRKQKTKPGIGPLQRSDGSYTDDPQEMCDILRSQYESVFSNPKTSFQIDDPDKFFFENNVTSPSFTDIDLSPEDFIEAIDEMPMHSAPGPDAWNSIFIKKCKNAIALPLCMIWRKSVDAGNIPDDKLLTDTCPLLKGGNKALAKNYRPIALTSHLTKIFERVLRKKLMHYMEENHFFNPGQHGFRSGRSCLSQLLDHLDQVLTAMEDKKNFDVIYTDFAKAFDKCDHGIIAHKLKKIGISGKIGRWIFYFLTHRFQRVIVDNFKSSPSKVKSSVPQGTVLAPLLFLILISDIDKDVTHSLVSSFADDTRISRIIADIGDTAILQQDLNHILHWAEENNMDFNEEKFQLIRYGDNKDIQLESSYSTASNLIIPQASSVKDLGVIMSDDLNFSLHHLKKIEIARKLSGWALRVFRTRDETPMLTLFKSLILPHLEYCCILTSPSKIGEISDLESVQRSFTSKIASVKHMNYWDRLKSLKLYSLERRRERYIIIYTWKILNSLVPNFTSDSSKITAHWSDRHGLKCKIPPVKNRGSIGSKRDNFLSVKGPKLFNILPASIRNSLGSEPLVFKKNLDKFLSTVPDEPSVQGYSSGRAAASNSLLDQVRHRRAWTETGPQG